VGANATFDFFSGNPLVMLFRIQPRNSVIKKAALAISEVLWRLNFGKQQTWIPASLIFSNQADF